MAVIRVAELAVPSSVRAGPATELPPAVPPNEDRTAEGVSPPVSVRVAPLTVEVEVEVPMVATLAVVLTLRLAPPLLTTLSELLTVVAPLSVDAPLTARVEPADTAPVSVDVPPTLRLRPAVKSLLADSEESPA